MSTKTSTIKRIALVAVAALGFGMLSTVAANAAVVASTTLTSPATVTSGTPFTIPVSVTGNPSESTSLTFSGGGNNVTWTAGATGNGVAVDVSASGTASDPVNIVKTNGSTQTFDLNVTLVGASGFTTTVSGAGLTFTLTVGSSTNGTLTLSSFVAPTGAAASGLFTEAATTIGSISFGLTGTSVAASGSGLADEKPITLSASIDKSTVMNAGFTGAGSRNTSASVIVSTLTGTGGNALTGTITSGTSGSLAVVYSGISYAFTATAAGTYNVTFTASSGTTVIGTATIQAVIATTPARAPWRAVVTGPDTTDATDISNIVVNNVIQSSTDYTVIQAVNDTAPKTGNATLDDTRWVSVTSSGTDVPAVFDNVATATGANAMLVEGFLGTTSKKIKMPLDGNIYGTSAGNQIWVNSATVGTVTVTFWDRTCVSGVGSPVCYETPLQTITIKSVAAAALDPVKSTSVIRANNSKLNSTNGVASSCQVSTQACGNTWLDTATEKDEVVIAPRKIVGLSTTTDAVASIKVRLLDSAGIGVADSILPSVGATVTGEGLVSISATPYGQSLTSTPGRNLSLTKAPANVFYINVFADGNAGKSTISILVGGAVWKTETLSFYGDATTVKAVQGRYVLPEGTVTSSSSLSFSYGCVGLTCDASTVDLSVASTLAVSDALGTPVPYRTFTATSSDAGVLLGVATATAGGANVPHLGVHHFQVTVPYATTATSGKSASLTYTTGTGATALSSNALTFTLGGKAASVKLSLAGKNGIGEMNTMSFAATDSAGNKAYDADHAAALTSNVVINTAVNSDQMLFSAAGDFVSVWNGTGTVDFYNPIVPTNLVIGGKVGGATVSATATISNAAADAAAAAAKAQAEKDAAAAIAAIEAATDAAAEAIDAANAATDAANLAAEAADAATVAAEEARDAADAATAAIEELATQVAALIAALQAQIKTLANTVAKIAKKVKA